MYRIVISCTIILKSLVYKLFEMPCNTDSGMVAAAQVTSLEHDHTVAELIDFSTISYRVLCCDKSTSVRPSVDRST
jgi:hypothetical protein